MKPFVICLFVLFLFKCDSRELMNLGKDNNGQSVEVSLAREIVISLESNPSTGYTWTLAGIDSTILAQTQQDLFEPRSELVGSPGRQIFHFKAIARGETALRLHYQRPWEKDVAPADTFSIEIKVTK